MSQPAKVSRVFISYSHDSDEHRARALALAQALRYEGVHAEIDQYVEETNPPHDWPSWMFRQLQEADFVIMVCTETYQRRVHDQEAPGRGYGARWEGAIIVHGIYTTESLSATSQYVPVVFDLADADHLPYFVAGASWYYVNPADMSGLDRLVRRFLGQRTVTPAPLPPSSRQATEKKPAPVREKRTAADFPTGRKVLGQVSREIADGKGAPQDIAETIDRRRRLRKLLDDQLPQEADDVKDRMVHLILTQALDEFEAAVNAYDSDLMERVFRRVHIQALETQNKWRADAPALNASTSQGTANSADVQYLIQTHYPNISERELTEMRSALSGIDRQELNAMMSDAATMRKVMASLRRNRP